MLGTVAEYEQFELLRQLLLGSDDASSLLVAQLAHVESAKLLVHGSFECLLLLFDCHLCEDLGQAAQDLITIGRPALLKEVDEAVEETLRSGALHQLEDQEVDKWRELLGEPQTAEVRWRHSRDEPEACYWIEQAHNWPEVVLILFW